MSQERFDVLIVGAGIAGTTLAKQYCQLGLHVCLIDEGEGPGRGTSAHAGAITHPAIGRTASKLHALSISAFRLALSDWQDHWESRGVFLQSKINIPFNEAALREKLQHLGLSNDIAELVSLGAAKERFRINRPGVWFSGAGSINLARQCERLLFESPSLCSMWLSRVDRIENDAGDWLALDQDGNRLGRAHTLVLANAFGAETLLERFKIKLFLKPVRGQLSVFEITRESKLLKYLPKVIVSGEGYSIPPHYDKTQRAHRWLVGSSYDEHNDCLEPSDQSDRHNLELARAMLEPAQVDLSELKVVERFVGIRCVTKDRLPLIGPMPGLDNLYVVSAIGSRGLLWATLASYIIPALSHSSAFALERLARFGLAADALTSLSPARFFAGALASNSKLIFPPTPRAR